MKDELIYILGFRFTDFQVNEIDAEGKIVELNSLEVNDGTKTEKDSDELTVDEVEDDIDINGLQL